jgi:hypothetical protein
MSQHVPPRIEPFAYQGPATIGGVAFEEVSLREEYHPFDFERPRSWRGSAVIPYTAWAPPHFGLPDTPTLEVELPDGRRGEVYAGADFVDNRWTLDLLGKGAVPLPDAWPTGP